MSTLHIPFGGQPGKSLPLRVGRSVLMVVLALTLAACSPPPAPPTPPPAAQTAPTPAAPPPVPSPPLPPGSEALVEQAIADAAQRTPVDPAAVRIVSVERREWSDASLGCPEPGQFYAQVITPGYLIVLEAGGRRFEYHTNTTGTIKLC